MQHAFSWVGPDQAQSVEEAKKRRDYLAKMRSLLFYQEIKLKRMAKIKSKDYHRRAKKAAVAKVILLHKLFPRNKPFPHVMPLSKCTQPLMHRAS
jgi:hypothetical protein